MKIEIKIPTIPIFFLSTTIAIPLICQYTHIHGPDWIQQASTVGPEGICNGVLFPLGVILTLMSALSLVISSIAYLED